VQASGVWFPGRAFEASSACAKKVPQPGSADTWESSVSLGPGWRGAAVGARVLIFINLLLV